MQKASKTDIDGRTLYWFSLPPNKECPGDGFLWHPEKEEWIKPRSPQEYAEWFYLVHFGEHYNPKEDMHPLTQEEFTHIMSEVKTPPKGHVWF